MSTAERYRQVARVCLKLAKATSNPKTTASMLNLAGYWARRADECAARPPRHHLAPVATAAMLLLSTSAFAADEIARDDVCTGLKPFREVAQDETRSMAELCRIQEEFLRGDRGWQDTPAYARGHGELPTGWAQSGNNIQMRKR
jgi:hypothetical protein